MRLLSERHHLKILQPPVQVSMARFCLSVFLFMVLVTSSFAQEVTGEGVGSTKEQAKKEALADLSQNISVEVKSVQTQLSELMGENFRQDASSMIQLESRLPLLGISIYTSLEQRF